jgi:uncharacterized membrane protein YgdD (TMEM256/DUF423 family)
LPEYWYYSKQGHDGYSDCAEHMIRDSPAWKLRFDHHYLSGDYTTEAETVDFLHAYDIALTRLWSRLAYTTRVNQTAARFGAIGALVAGLAVAAGAFGAHALRDMIPADRIEIFETAARYQMYHGLALFAVAWLIDRRPGGVGTFAGVAFVAGVAVFSGSLYALALSGVRILGAITPIGGIFFLAGWAALVVAFLAPRRQPAPRPIAREPVTTE